MALISAVCLFVKVYIVMVYRLIQGARSYSHVFSRREKTPIGFFLSSPHPSGAERSEAPRNVHGERSEPHITYITFACV